jgi:DNA-binding response OmpR family regulator
MDEHDVLPDVSVVVVDDEADLADVYAKQLAADNDVTVAQGGEQALDEIDHTTDVVLLDRRMPGLSGDEVLDHIRECAYGCRVVMVTAVEPDLDVVDLRFEDYITKPVKGEELRRVVNEQVIYARYERAIREYTRVRSKIDLLLSSKLEQELVDQAGFRELCLRAHSIKAEIEQLFADHDESIPIDATEE